MGFVYFTKLSFTLSSLAQSFDQMESISEYVFVIVIQRKAYAGRFQKEIAGKRTGPITKWPSRRLLFTRLEIVSAIISPLWLFHLLLDDWGGNHRLLHIGLRSPPAMVFTKVLLTWSGWCNIQ